MIAALPKVPTSAALPADLISFPDALRRGGMHRSTLRRWIVQGKVRAWRRGWLLFVSQAEIDSQTQIVPVALQPDAAARLEEEERDRETDATLRAVGVRR